MKILVALDGSEHSRVSVPAAIRLAVGWQADIELVSIMDLGYYSTELGLQPPGNVVDEQLRYLGRELAEQQAVVQARGVKVTTFLEEGPAAQRILTRAADTRADLVVMAPHQRSAAHHVLVGSVVDKVLHHAPCPVLVVRATGEPGPGRIVVPLDGSSLAEQSMAAVVALARVDGRHAMLLRVLQNPHPQPHEYNLYRAWSQAALADAEEREHLNLKRLAASLQAQNVQASTMLEHGSPSEIILENCRAGDLVVLTKHSQTWLTRALAGSTTQNIVHHAPCSVLVLCGESSLWNPAAKES